MRQVNCLIFLAAIMIVTANQQLVVEAANLGPQLVPYPRTDPDAGSVQFLQINNSIVGDLAHGIDDQTVLRSTLAEIELRVEPLANSTTSVSTTTQPSTTTTTVIAKSTSNSATRLEIVSYGDNANTNTGSAASRIQFNLGISLISIMLSSLTLRCLARVIIKQ